MITLTDRQYEILRAAADALSNAGTFRICTNCRIGFIREGEICPTCQHDPSYDTRRGKTIDKLLDIYNFPELQ